MFYCLHNSVTMHSCRRHYNVLHAYLLLREQRLVLPFISVLTAVIHVHLSLLCSFPRFFISFFIPGERIVAILVPLLHWQTGQSFSLVTRVQIAHSCTCYTSTLIMDNWCRKWVCGVVTNRLEFHMYRFGGSSFQSMWRLMSPFSSWFVPEFLISLYLARAFASQLRDLAVSNL